MKFQVLIRSPKTEKRVYRNSFKEAKALALKGKEMYKDRPDVQVYLISCQKAFAPPRGWVKRKMKHSYWCPYCGAERKFRPNHVWNVYQCPICNITTADYHVRKYNHLWDKGGKKK